MAAKLDLDKLDFEELKTLSKDIEKAIRKRETDNLRKAREAAEAAAKEYGFSLDEIMGAKTEDASTERRKIGRQVLQSRRSETNLVGTRSPAAMVQGRSRWWPISRRSCGLKSRATMPRGPRHGSGGILNEEEA